MKIQLLCPALALLLSYSSTVASHGYQDAPARAPRSAAAAAVKQSVTPTAQVAPNPPDLAGQQIFQ